MGPVENNIDLLVKELKRSNFKKDDALDYLGHVFKLIASNNVSSDQRHGAALTVNDLLIKARAGKSLHSDQRKSFEIDYEAFDVNEMGC